MPLILYVPGCSKANTFIIVTSCQPGKRRTPPTRGVLYWQEGRFCNWGASGGNDTNIWIDQWLPGGVGMKPLCRKDEAIAEQVSELLSPDGSSWNDAALEQNLVPLDAEAARRIPLGRSMTDSWAWSGERHGMYTIKSGYHLLAASEAQQ